MSDVLTKEQRHRCMSRIRGKDTSPERRVRSMIHKMGFRYRLHGSDLPGKPDIIFPRLRKIIFVHGCFWHFHRCRFGLVKPATNAKFWEIKRLRNQQRDGKVRRTLHKIGWGVLTVWECELRDDNKLQKKVQTFLTK